MIPKHKQKPTNFQLKLCERCKKCGLCRRENRLPSDSLSTHSGCANCHLMTQEQLLSATNPRKIFREFHQVQLIEHALEVEALSLCLLQGLLVGSLVEVERLRILSRCSGFHRRSNLCQSPTGIHRLSCSASRSTGDDFERTNSSQFTDDRIVHAIDQIFLLRIAGEIFQNFVMRNGFADHCIHQPFKNCWR